MRGVVGAAIAAATLAWAAAPAAGATTVLRSGALRAEVSADPFSIAFVDAKDGERLATVPGGQPLDRFAGLGFSADLRRAIVGNAYFGYEIQATGPMPWFHATRLTRAVADGPGRLTLDVATDDPGGTHLQVVLAAATDGVIRVHAGPRPGSGPLASFATTTGAAFSAESGREHFMGFGSRSNRVDQTGNMVFDWAEEGPFSSGDHDALIKGLLPDFTFPTGPTATNFPMPWLVSSRGFGVLVDTPERSTFDLLHTRTDAWRVEAEAGTLDLTVVGGPQPADVVARYSGLVGRQPRPAGWLFGPWVQFDGNRDRQFVADDVPTTVAQTYTHYLPCGAGRDARAERARVARAHELGMKITTYFNPHVCTSYRAVYDDAARRGLFVKDATGRPYLLSNPFTADQITSEIDFSNPGGRALYERLIDEALDNGYDGWMEDFGEYTPTDGRLADGTDGLHSHNRYPVLYHCTSYEHTKARRGADLAVFIRSGWSGVQPCARAVWGGDPTEDWSCSDGLCAAVHQLLNQGISGIAYQGSDIGGFHAIVNHRTDDELTDRWLQVGFASGIMRTQATGYSFLEGRSKRSQVWSPAVQPVWRRYAKLRTQLYPYLAAASDEYQRTGMPMARQLALVWPDDRRAVQTEDEWMLGPDLLVAPVLTRGARTRALHLPAGGWVDLWRSVGWDERPGRIRPTRARVLAGGGATTVDAPLTQLPLFVRAGAVLPLIAPDVDTLATLGGDSTVSLHERRRRLELLAFPRGHWTGRFYSRRGRLRSDEQPGRWALRIASTRRRSVTLRAAMSALRHPFTPCIVSLNDRRLPDRGWSYDRKTQVLTASFTAARATLRVSRCVSAPGRERSSLPDHQGQR